jgi:subtilase family serine protease
VPFLVGDGTPLESSRAGAKATIGPGGGLTPTDLSSAYGFNPTASGRGQTVALVDAYNDPDINNELETFDTQYRLVVCNIKNSCLKVVGQTGTSSLPANDTTGWAVEESLDVEAVHSVCERCKILLVEANTSSNSDLAAAVQTAVRLKATEISNSYGSPESSQDAGEYNHPGVVITAAAGDDGYYSFDELAASGSVNAPDTPAAFPTVVAVGGTSLYLGQRGGRQSETVWNDNGVEDVFEEVLGQALGAGGGGCSARFTAPQWQHKVAGWSGTGCGTRRLVSDISAVADPLTGFDIFHSYNCGEKCLLLGWTTVGGTSLASPIIAAMFALAGGAHGVAYPAETLYSHLGNSTDLYDVTSGGNGFCDGEGAAACGDWNLKDAGVVDCDFTAAGMLNVGDRACDALAGYDGPSGVGTPKGLGAFKKG